MKQETGHNPSDSGYRSALDKAETPETDANLLRGVCFDTLDAGVVLAELCRKFERENKALKERVARLEEFAADLQARARMAEQKLFNPNTPTGW